MELVSVGMPTIPSRHHGRTICPPKPSSFIRKLTSRRLLGFSSFRIYGAKSSEFQQEFQDFAKPSRLLHCKEIYLDSYTPEELYHQLELNVSSSLYFLSLQTSDDYNSSLDVANSAISICLIDEYGESLIQRLSPFPSTTVEHLKDMSAATNVRFQKGSVDVIVFCGQKLGRIKALWIGIESGTWRLKDVGLTIVFPRDFPLSPGEEMTCQYDGTRYGFENTDIIFGEGFASIAELRPFEVIELSNISPFDVTEYYQLGASTQPKNKLTLEDSMREYGDLKSSMLLYDALLVTTGTFISANSGSDATNYFFLAGGTLGFLYLLQLQRSVDELSPASVKSENVETGWDKVWQVLNVIRKPLPIVFSGLAAVFLVSKYASEDIPGILNTQDLLALAIGFFLCKISVVLAAFKPIRRLK